MVYLRSPESAEFTPPELRMSAILRGVRTEAGFTQEELGVRIGRYFGFPAIGQKTISRWEAKVNPSAVPGYYLGAIATVCNVSPERLMV